MNFNKNNQNKKKEEDNRFSSLSDPQSNTFLKQNSKYSRRDNNRNDDRYNDRSRYNNRYNNGHNNFTSYNVPKKENEVDLNNKDDFPTIVVPINKNVVDKPKEEGYLEKCKKKQKEEEESGIINTKLGKYWRGNIWVGPIMMKHNKSQSTGWKNYMEAVKENPPASIIIPGRVLYSRDNKNWYNSYQETFTENEWTLMEEQKNNEAMEKMHNDFCNMCDRLEARYEKESWEYYQLTGELDGWALAKKEMAEYEEYCKQFEDNDDEEISMESDEYTSD